MKCRECGSDMYLDDKDCNFKGNYDNYWNCEKCQTSCIEQVRCLECKQGEIDDPDFPDEYYCHAGCGWNKGDFYCAYGERKEGAD